MTDAAPKPATGAPKRLIDWSRDTPYIISLMLMTLVVQLAIGPGMPGEMAPLFTDNFTYMVRIAETPWWSSRGWFPYFNAPEGMILHWTYPFSAFVSLMALPLSLFMAWPDALLLAGTVSSFVGMLAVVVLSYYLARSINTRGWAFTAALVVLASRPVISYGAFGRPDHHMMSLALVAGFWLCLILIERFHTTFAPSIGATNRAPADDTVTTSRQTLLGLSMLAGVIAGLALWTTPETMAGLVLGLALQCWHRLLMVHADPPVGNHDPRWFGDLLMVLGWVGLSAVALIIDPPFEGLWAAAHDRFSIVHLAFAACTGLLLIGRMPLLAAMRHQPSSGLIRPMIALGILGLMAVGSFLALFPTAGSGAMNHVAPALETWLSNIKEMRPTRGAYEMYINLSTPMLGLFGLILYYEYHKENTDKGILLLGVGATAVLLILTLTGAMYFRFLYFSVVAAAPFIGLLLAQLAATKVKALQPENTLAVLIGGPILAVQIAAAIAVESTPEYHLFAYPSAYDTARNQELAPTRDAAGRLVLHLHPLGQAACDDHAMIDALTPLIPQLQPKGDGDRFIGMFYQNPGPALVYKAGIKVVAAPYHRNTEGLMDERRFFGTGSLADVYEVIDRRAVDLAGICIKPVIDQPDLERPAAYDWALQGGDDRFAPMLIIPGEWVVLARRELLGDWSPVIKQPETTDKKAGFGHSLQ